MPQINSGSYLTREEINENKYKFNQPLIRLCCMSLLVLACSSCAVMCLAVGYAKYNKPKPIVATAEYQKAQKQAARLNKRLAVLRETRPNNLNVCNIVNVIANAATSVNVKINDISVDAKKFIIKGTAQNVEQANKFADTLNLGQEYQKTVNDIKASGTESDLSFSVTVLPKLTANPPTTKGGTK